MEVSNTVMLLWMPVKVHSMPVTVHALTVMVLSLGGLSPEFHSELFVFNPFGVDSWDG